MMDKKQQRQVWQRVYAPQPQTAPVNTQALWQCHRRLRQNLEVLERQGQHPIYGPAFSHLALKTREQMQMLQQILDGQR